MCDFMIIQDDLSPEHTVCLTGCVLLPPLKSARTPSAARSSDLLSAAILLWLHKGCCCQREWGGNVRARRDEFLYKHYRHQWEKLPLTAQPRERRAHMAPARVQGTCLESERQLFIHSNEWSPSWWDPGRIWQWEKPQPLSLPCGTGTRADNNHGMET